MPFDYRQNYENELAERDKLRSALSVPIGLLTILGGVTSYMLRTVHFGWDLLSIVFGMIMLAALISAVIAAYYLVRAMHGHTYKQIESAMQLRRYHLDLRAWYEAYDPNPAGADREFDDYLEQSYAKAADHNCWVNTFRSESLFLTNRYIVISALLAGLAFPLFLLNVQMDEDEHQKLEINLQLPPNPGQTAQGDRNAAGAKQQSPTATKADTASAP